MSRNSCRITVTLATWILVAVSSTTVFAHPGSGIAVDSAERVYFVDTGGGVWRIEPNGALVHHGNPRFHWMAIDPNARPAAAPLPSVGGGEITAVGSDPTVLVSSDVPIAVGNDGAIYYPELGRDQRLRIMKFTRAGVRTAFALLTARQGTALRWINGLAAGRDGSLYYTEDRAVRRIDRSGVVSTVAENITLRECRSIPGTERGTEPFLRGLAVAADGTVFVAASGCGALVRIASRGESTTVLRTTSPWSPTAVALSPSGIYVLEYLHTAAEDRQAWVPRVRKLLPDGRIIDIATVRRPTGH